MFNNKHYVTKGVCETIPPLLQIFMWERIRTMPVEKDYLQVFNLSKNGNRQSIIHTQEVPEYRKEYYILSDNAVNSKIFVIDDNTHSTMLLAEEY